MANTVVLWVIVYFCVTSVNTKDNGDRNSGKYLLDHICDGHSPSSSFIKLFYFILLNSFVFISIFFRLNSNNSQNIYYERFTCNAPPV